VSDEGRSIHSLVANRRGEEALAALRGCDQQHPLSTPCRTPQMAAYVDERLTPGGEGCYASRFPDPEWGRVFFIGLSLGKYALGAVSGIGFKGIQPCITGAARIPYIRCDCQG
jgi:hypothetical protein